MWSSLSGTEERNESWVTLAYAFLHALLTAFKATVTACLLRAGHALCQRQWSSARHGVGASVPPGCPRKAPPRSWTLSVSGERCRSFIELTPPTERGEKGLLEFATLQGPRHPTLRFGGKRLTEKAFLPHPPLGLVASTWV